MEAQGSVARVANPGSADGRTHRRLARARARTEAWSRRKRQEVNVEPVAFADPFFVDPFCLLAPR